MVGVLIRRRLGAVECHGVGPGSEVRGLGQLHGFGRARLLDGESRHSTERAGLLAAAQADHFNDGVALVDHERHRRGERGPGPGIRIFPHQ